MSYRLEQAARELVDWFRNNVGDTDDWPAEMNFDDTETAEHFCNLLNRVEQILEERE